MNFHPALATAPFLFIDIETNPQKENKIFKIGAFRTDIDWHLETGTYGNRAQLIETLKKGIDGAQFLVGHNIISHDLLHLSAQYPEIPWSNLTIIDTLRLSPIAFPENPYHRLLKNYKLISDERNSPLKDCYACATLFYDQCQAFAAYRRETPDKFNLYLTFTKSLPIIENDAFQYLSAQQEISKTQLGVWIKSVTDQKNDIPRVCKTAFQTFIRATYPLLGNEDERFARAYVFAWLSVSGGNSVLPAWVAHQYPQTQTIIEQLREKSCADPSCVYCQHIHNASVQLEKYFGFKQFRAEPKLSTGGSMQQAIVEAGMNGEHLLAILPTGGGKSICFQIPALTRYFMNGGLTIVISPLQSLMKDQVDNLRNKTGIHSVDMLNGMLSMSERGEVLQRIAYGDTGILFVAPEQFRNKSFIAAISNRQINGWVFDEAHCLSKWGQDFRPDYLYAAKFIKENSAKIAPISCFTATAKIDVLNDIKTHFREALGIQFKEFIGGHARTNLSYEVLSSEASAKNFRIQELLEQKLKNIKGGGIVFVAKRRHAEKIADFLIKSGWSCRHFHAGLPPSEKETIQNQFILGDLKVIVATNAFGMGVDKSDVRLVIHADIPGSLENYLQEAGRAGRDQKAAECILLFNQKDIDAQFQLSKRNEVTLKDFQQVWKILHEIDSKRKNKKYHEDEIVASTGDLLLNQSALSFDEDDHQADTKVKTIIAWLERITLPENGLPLLTRNINRTQIFPSRSSKMNLETALSKLKTLEIPQVSKELYAHILRIVFTAKKDEPINTDTLIAETATTYEEIFHALRQLEQHEFLKNDTQMTIYVSYAMKNQSRDKLARWWQIEQVLWQHLPELLPEADNQELQLIALAELCQLVRTHTEFEEILPNDVAKLMYALASDNDSKSNTRGSLLIRPGRQAKTLTLKFLHTNDTWKSLLERAELRHHLCQLILEFLLAKLPKDSRGSDLLVELRFSELLEQMATDIDLKSKITIERREDFIHHALVFMHQLKIITLNHGMAIMRQAMTIKINPKATKVKIKKSDFANLATFYDEKSYQIHVMRRYVKEAIEKGMVKALQLVDDYFRIPKLEFIKRFFPGQAAALALSISPETYHKIVATLNATQRSIVEDSQDDNHLVLAGPGSGKTRLIVHRVAYLLMIRHIPPQAIIVLTFNRAAAQEIRSRLYALIGDMVYGCTIRTYDGLVMQLLGETFDEEHPFNEELLKKWCYRAIKLLNNALDDDEINASDNQRAALLTGFQYLLVDEYQDINEQHYQLVSALVGRNVQDNDDKLTLLAVGDDDQNIYEFRKTSNQYIERFCQDYQIETPDYLTENYRATRYLIEAANHIIDKHPNRLKKAHPIHINAERENNPAGGIWQDCAAMHHGKVTLVRTSENLEQQVAVIYRQLQRIKSAANDFSWADCTVISRHNKILAMLESLCRQCDIPYARKTRDIVKLYSHRQYQRLKYQLKKHKTLSREKLIKIIQDQDVEEEWKTRFNTWCEEIKSTFPTESEISIPAILNWCFTQLDDAEHTLKQGKNGLTLTTAHSAKGLEFKHIIIVDDEWEKDNETRRLFYVALTRAQETATILYANNPYAEELTELTNILSLDAETTELQNIDLSWHFRIATPKEINYGYLSNLYPKQKPIDKTIWQHVIALRIGDELFIDKKDGRFLCDASGYRVLQWSKNTDLDWQSDNCKIHVSYIFMHQADDKYRHNPEFSEFPVIVPEFFYRKVTQ